MENLNYSLRNTLLLLNTGGVFFALGQLGNAIQEGTLRTISTGNEVFLSWQNINHTIGQNVADFSISYLADLGATISASALIPLMMLGLVEKENRNWSTLVLINSLVSVGLIGYKLMRTMSGGFEMNDFLTESLIYSIPTIISLGFLGLNIQNRFTQ